MFENLFDLGGLSLDRLRNFCLIAEAGGIARAAEGDPAKQSLFSRQIKELESFFGVELKRRQGKGIVLTDSGMRLARIAREQFKALSDFQNECQNEPITLTIGSGNSIIEWMLLPKLGAIQAALPNVTIDLVDQRTADNVRGLTEMTIDIAIVRKDAVSSPLKSSPLDSLEYALFVPRRLMKREMELRGILETLPLATSKGGSFREFLDSSTARAKLPLNVTLSCASFTQAARAARSGRYCAILPNIAAVDLPEPDFLRIELTFMKEHRRRPVIAWNPRIAAIRSAVALGVDVIGRVLGD